MHGGKSSAQPADSNSSSIAMTPTYVDSPRKVKAATPVGTGGTSPQGPDEDGRGLGLRS